MSQNNGGETALVPHQTELSASVSAAVDSHDSTQQSISSVDTIHLMYHRFLDVLILDLQPSMNDPDAPEDQIKIQGAIALPSLAQQLLTSPNLGSAIHALLCHSALRTLLSSLSCTYLLVYDRDGQGEDENSTTSSDTTGPPKSSWSSSGVARMFVKAWKEVSNVTGQKRFGGVKSVRYLRGGAQRFGQLYPGLCITRQTVIAESFDAAKEIADVLQPTIEVNKNDVAEESSSDEVQDDPPCLILDDFLYLGGIQSTTREHIVSKGITHVISIGETPFVLTHPTAQRYEMNVQFPSPVRRSRPAGGLEVGEIEVSRSAASTCVTSPISPDKKQKLQLPASVNDKQDPVPELTQEDPIPTHAPVSLPMLEITSDQVTRRMEQVDLITSPRFTVTANDVDSGWKSHRRHKFVHYALNLEDAAHAPIHTLFATTNHIIHQASQRNEKVLVHCYGGVSRSVTVVLAYMVCKTTMIRKQKYWEPCLYFYLIFLGCCPWHVPR
jgi:predicted protein tyrosine phosphatase